MARERSEGNILEPKWQLSPQVMNIKIIPSSASNFLYNNCEGYNNPKGNASFKSYTGIKDSFPNSELLPFLPAFTYFYRKLIF